jgi:diguanylate cyclase (GGDEF)-like protein
MSRHERDFSSVSPASLDEENALLRASLAEARTRIGELERLADRDALTQLPNRRRFLVELERVTSAAARHGTPAALLSIEIAGLEAINERHGRLGGDAALLHVARLLSGLIRGTDHLARLAGDAFALILDRLDPDSAIDTAERLGRCLAAEPLDFGGARVAVRAIIATTSILAGDSVDEVLARAERNLALARDGG